MLVFSEIGGKALLWDGRQTLLRRGRRRRPTEEADGVFLTFFMIGRADGLTDEVVKIGSDRAKSGGTRR